MSVQDLWNPCKGQIWPQWWRWWSIWILISWRETRISLLYLNQILASGCTYDFRAASVITPDGVT